LWLVRLVMTMRMTEELKNDEIVRSCETVKGSRLIIARSNDMLATTESARESALSEMSLPVQ
jgi:hypothetical protein